ncbi:unnamed protein product, partial [Brassica napus]
PHSSPNLDDCYTPKGNSIYLPFDSNFASPNLLLISPFLIRNPNYPQSPLLRSFSCNRAIPYLGFTKNQTFRALVIR